MAIVVTNLNNVLVDGVAAGDIVSVMANYKPRVVEILAALKAWAKANDDKAAVEISTLRVERDALGTKPEAQAILKAKRRTEAQAKAAAAAAELAALDAEPEPAK